MTSSEALDRFDFQGVRQYMAEKPEWTWGGDSAWKAHVPDVQELRDTAQKLIDFCRYRRLVKTSGGYDAFDVRDCPSCAGEPICSCGTGGFTVSRDKASQEWTLAFARKSTEPTEPHPSPFMQFVWFEN